MREEGKETTRSRLLIFDPFTCVANTRLLWNMSPTTRYNCPRSTGQLDTRTMARFMLPLLCATLFLLDSTVVGFNFDLRAPVQFSGPQGSLFGFSVAQHKDGNTDW